MEITSLFYSIYLKVKNFFFFAEKMFLDMDMYVKSGSQYKET